MTAKDLTNALLQEAVQGKLVPQIASEGNAKDLLEEIKKEKAKAAGKASSTSFANKTRTKELPTITDDEIPFDIPENWCWCRLGEIINLLSGQDFEPDFYNSKNEGIPYITGASNIDNNRVIINRWTKTPKCIANNGDLLLVCKGSGYGTTVFADFEQAHIARQIMALKAVGNINCLKYIEIVLQTQIKNIKSQGKGVIPGIDRNSVLSIVVPLPPLAEQKRIVAAIEQFMPLIEEYGKKEAELTALNADIAKVLKNAILQEAVQGKLAPQIASEGNAKDLLEEIKKEKAKLIKEGKLKKEKPLPEITEDEIPFDIPEKWCWCRLGEICTKLVDGDHNPPAGLQEKTEYLMLSSRNINNDKLVDLDLVRYLSKEVFEKENERTKAEKDDIFFTSVGTLGRSCIFDGSLNVSFQRSVSIIRTEIFNYYLKYWLDSGYVQNYVVKNATGTAQKGFYLNQLTEVLIPLPPLAEQKRIVDAIENMLPLCEKIGE